MSLKRTRKAAILSTETLLLFIASIAIAAIVIGMLMGQLTQPPPEVDATNSFIKYVGSNTYELYMKIKNPSSKPFEVTKIEIYDDSNSWVEITADISVSSSGTSTGGGTGGTVGLVLEPKQTTILTGQISSATIGKKTSYELKLTLDNGEVLYVTLPIR